MGAIEQHGRTFTYSDLFGSMSMAADGASDGVHTVLLDFPSKESSTGIYKWLMPRNRAEDVFQQVKAMIEATGEKVTTPHLLAFGSTDLVQKPQRSDAVMDLDGIAGKNVPEWLVPVISDAFNMSINALEDAGAIDTRKLRKQYTGIGSKYYDIVTAQIGNAIKLNLSWIIGTATLTRKPVDKSERPSP